MAKFELNGNGHALIGVILAFILVLTVGHILKGETHPENAIERPEYEKDIKHIRDDLREIRRLVTAINNRGVIP